MGLSTGAAARLNAISENCGDDTKRELQAGEITLMGAYRRAQEIIAERMAQQESAKALKPDKPVHEKPVVFDCKPESSVTVPKQSPESHCTPQNIPAGYEPKATESHGLPEKPEESRGKDTLRKLAEKELSQKALWTFDRNLFIYQLDFYKHSLPGGAELYRMEDRQKDEHKRYAIILQDYEFFTSGWESYEEAVESLVRYLSLK